LKNFIDFILKQSYDVFQERTSKLFTDNKNAFIRPHVVTGAECFSTDLGVLSHPPIIFLISGVFFLKKYIFIHLN